MKLSEWIKDYTRKINRNQKMTNLKLPSEIIVTISKYLNIKDKLKLRLINKTFKFIFDNLISLNRLTLISSDQREFNYNWFYTNRSNKEIDLIEFNSINILNNQFKNNLFLNIKLLFFQSLNEINLNETINQLKYLEELNIYCKIESNSILSLSKLKILSIKQHYSSNIRKIEFETPSLSFLRCDDIRNYQFNYPENIIYLDTEFARNYNEIEIFKNLKYLILYECREFKFILLTKLDQLIELHLNKQNEKELNIIKEINKNKLRSNLKNLRIFICGIDYENLKQLNEDEFINCKKIELILNNYSNTIDILPFVDHMDFDRLFEFLNSNPNISFDNIICKFPNIKHVTAINLTEMNIDCFFKFLSKCENLFSLYLKLLIDNQIYYLNKLPDSCNRIENLDLYNLNVDESTNLDFLFKFKKLYYLTLGKLDDLNILKNLSDNLNVLIFCEFIYRENSFCIDYNNNIYVHDDLEFENSDSLIKHLDNLIDEEDYIDKKI